MNFGILFEQIPDGDGTWGEIILSGLGWTLGTAALAWIMAFVLGLDPAFVAAHHLMRFLGLALIIPLVARLLFGAAVVPSEKTPIDDTEPKD